MKYLQQHEKQYEFACSLKPIRVLFWGNRVGKTEGGAQETSRYLTPDAPDTVEVIARDLTSLGKLPLPKRQLYHPIEVWCGCPSFDLQKDTTQKKLQAYLPKSAIVNAGRQVGHAPG